MSILRVSDLLEQRSKSLGLSLLAGESGLNREITSADISSPGLVLAGFTDRFPSRRIQVLGETEIMFLRSLEAGRRSETLREFLDAEMPLVIVTKGLEAPAELLALADEESIPVLLSNLKTGEFYRRIKPFLEEEFAPTTAIHGSLADVYGVGLLFVGASGIGKSECVLDLVERGHRLVADDVVLVRRRGFDVLIGQAHERQQHHMEIRGIGIIDVRALFGVRAVRQQKRIEVVVQLEHWREDATYDRTGLERDKTEILDTPIPRVVVPLNPGKNITVISEVVAMNHLLRYAGVDSARMFEQNLRHLMQPVRDYLEEDYE
ncbi:MAG: HPr(Ser) kinase/phosphatase [Candidatus Palauibacterales bacterium]|nr:HPr(Ser) kinase/phosphatase [Candidatus Palauibacterales bacterium]MDP2483495.1 HPr(Ser) kinase/phosphatase [Candidatus Palauibacterales bacterium]